jgi:hypothetical protein
MNRLLRVFLVGFLVLSRSFVVNAADPTSPALAETARDDLAKPEDWVIHLEFIALAIPLDRAFPLLDDLTDEAKLAAAYSEVHALVKKGIGKRIGTQMLQLAHGSRELAETNEEVRYPIEFGLPVYPNLDFRTDLAAAAKATKNLALPATNYESRKVGLSLDARANVSADGNTFHVKGEVRHVRLVKQDEYASGITPEGMRITVQQPRFYSGFNSGMFFLRAKVPALVGVHMPWDLPNTVELFFLRAHATRKHAPPVK